METWVEDLPQKKFFTRVSQDECLVTISMLISNRIESVEKCFESFRPLLEQVPSEFIVVDTVGDEHSDGSLDIARKYADKVVHYKWDNDFAKARNAGLKYARGKWFIYLDDDEWFENIEPLIDFFSNPKLYNQYTRVDVMEHSFTSANQIDFGSNEFVRISRITPESKFVNPVHEVLVDTPKVAAYKLSGTIVLHTGYMGQKVKEKAQRNQEIMQAELKKTPTNLHLWLQLIAGAGRPKPIIEMAQEALDVAQKYQLVDWHSQVYVEIYLYRSKAYAKLKMDDEVEKTATEFIKNCDDPFYQGIVAEFMLEVSLNSRKDEKAALYWYDIYQKAIVFLKKLDKTPAQITYFFAGDINTDRMYVAFEKILNVLKDKEDNPYADVQKLIKLTPWTVESRKRQAVLALALKQVFAENDQALLENLAQTSLNDEKLKPEFDKSLDMVDLDLETQLAQQQFDQMVQKLTVSDDTIWLKQNRTQKLTFEDLKAHLSSGVTGEYPNESLIWLCINNQLSPQRYYENVAVENLNQAAHFLVVKAAKKLEEMPKKAALLEEIWEPTIQRNYFLAVWRRRYMFQGSMPYESVLSEARKYSGNMTAFAENYYAKALCQANSPLLPAEVRFAFFLKAAFAYQEQGNLSQCLAALNQALDVYPTSEKLIKRIIQKLDLDRRKQTVINEELNKLAAQVKGQIIALIGQGQKEAASQLLTELKQLTPQDPEITMIENLI